MEIKRFTYALAILFTTTSLATAAQQNSMMFIPAWLHPVVALQGGYASINIGNNTQRYTGTDGDIFTYANNHSTKDRGFIGAFLGAEFVLPAIMPPDFYLQTGVEYNYFGNFNVTGINTVGLEPQIATTYNYSYRLQTQQVLAVLKLFAPVYERLHIYGEVGLGAAFNQMGRFRLSTNETGALNLSPEFSGQEKTQFSFILGLGLQADVYENIRIGIGYRYSHLGSAALQNGAISINNYRFPVSFAPDTSNIATNQLFAQISYVA